MSWLLADIGWPGVWQPNHCGVHATREDVIARAQCAEENIVWLADGEHPVDDYGGPWHGSGLFVAFEIPDASCATASLDHQEPS